MPGGQKWPDLSPRKRTLLRSQIPVTTASLAQRLDGRVEFKATLYSRHLVRRESGKEYSPPEKLSLQERKLALAESETLDFSAAAFRSWLDEKGLRRKQDESDLDFGRRAFLAITRSYQYYYSESLDRHVSATCQQNRSDCGGLAALFAATMRVNKIPARLLIGHWAKSQDPDPPPQGRVSHKCHCKAEFYVEGIGWVPVDLSGAVEFDKTPEGLRFFGHEKGDFLTLQLDYDVRDDSGLFGVKEVPPSAERPLSREGGGRLQKREDRSQVAGRDAGRQESRRDSGIEDGLGEKEGRQARRSRDRGDAENPSLAIRASAGQPRRDRGLAKSQ